MDRARLLRGGEVEKVESCARHLHFASTPAIGAAVTGLVASIG